MVEWFRKSKQGLISQKKRDIPEGLWTKCPDCGEIIYVKELEKNLNTCNHCDYHFKFPSRQYVKLLLDDGLLEEHDAGLISGDPLKFRDSKKYTDRIRDARKKTGQNDAVLCGVGRIDMREVSFAIMDFAFVGGSMGSVVGEKIARTIDRALLRRIPLIVVSCSGGARMQESILSLMQMAKTSALLARLDEVKAPFISILTNPTTAGVMASYASLGDVIIAEPKALLGFAGKRVIQQTIGEELPPGFQSSEFFMEHGFLDKIVHRRDLKSTVSSLLGFLC
jgi:acetyl-CoA carboxylase carboxyl transferase subunit beta